MARFVLWSFEIETLCTVVAEKFRILKQNIQQMHTKIERPLTVMIKFHIESDDEPPLSLISKDEGSIIIPLAIIISASCLSPPSFYAKFWKLFRPLK
jgi:hypothetical protein